MKGNDTPVIVLGGMNDGQHSNTANILTEQPRYLLGESKGGDTSLQAAQTLQEYRNTRDVHCTPVHQATPSRSTTPWSTRRSTTTA